MHLFALQDGDGVGKRGRVVVPTKARTKPLTSHVPGWQKVITFDIDIKHFAVSSGLASISVLEETNVR